MIRYPISFWMTFCVVVVTSLLAVSWHGALLVVAVANVGAIMVLPAVSRAEMRYRKSKDQQEKIDVVIPGTGEAATSDRH